MKKNYLFLISMLSSLSVISCSNGNGGGSLDSFSCADPIDKYHLTVEEPALPISPDLPKSGDYQVDHLFSFKVEILTDVQYVPYLNDKKLVPVNEADGYMHYSFQMPAVDSTLILTSNPYYEDKSYRFDDIFTWATEINETTLKGVKIEEGFIGSNPENIARIQQISPTTLISLEMNH